jgi:hypothetical protein
VIRNREADDAGADDQDVRPRTHSGELRLAARVRLRGTTAAAEGHLSEQEAITVARRLMRDNQYACFDLDGTRAAIRAQLAPAEVA